jgi:hypothetical protein
LVGILNYITFVLYFISVIYVSRETIVINIINLFKFYLFMKKKHSSLLAPRRFSVRSLHSRSGPCNSIFELFIYCQTLTLNLKPL